MGRRSDIDWDTIERDYRLGELTDSELARSRGVGRGSLLRKARREGWTRDLSREVRARTRAALINKESQRAVDSKVEPNTDVERAVATNVAVIERHQAVLQKGSAVAEKLLAELDQATENREALEDAIEEETAADKSPKRRAMMLKAVSLASRAGAVNALSNTVRNFIAAERRAFNLDEPGEGDEPSAPGGTKIVIVPAKDGNGAPTVRKIHGDDAA